MILPKKILIVEDELITQRYIKNTMQNINIEVIGATDNAEDTIEILKNNQCDMILMDINIRGQKDGILLAKDILRDRELPILFISAYNDDETLDEILEFSSDGFISKPFTSRELEIAVQVSYKAFINRQKNRDSLLSVDRDIRLTETDIFSQKDKILYHNNIAIKFTHHQQLLIELLIKNLHHTVSKEEIIVTIWHKEDISDSAIRTLIYSIRKLVPTLSIKSHSKIGYYIDKEDF